MKHSVLLATTLFLISCLASAANPVLDLRKYTEEAQAAASKGDMEQAGILYRRTGDLYRNNFFDYPAAIARYRMAIECFKASKLQDQVMTTHLALADMLLEDSTDLARRHIDTCLTMAESLEDDRCILPAISLLTEIYIIQGQYRKIVDSTENTLRHISKSTTADDDEKTALNSIYTNIARSWLHIGKPDSARCAASKIFINGASDSIGLYSILSTAARIDGDWEEAMNYRMRADRLSDSINYNAYVNQLLALERENAANILQAELQKKKISNLITLIILLSVSLILLTGTIVLRHLLVVYKTKARQEEESRIQLSRMLSSQLSANRELIRHLGRTDGMIDGIADNMFRYESNPELVSKNVLSIVSEYISEESSLQRAENILEAAYPGLLRQIYSRSTKLTEEDRRIIALTACGYSTGALCAMLGISENYLNVKKLRIARKLDIKGGLTKFLKEKVNTYCSL